MNAYKKERIETLLEQYHKGNLGVTMGYFALAVAVVVGAYIVQDPVRWLPFFLLAIFAANYFRSVGKQNLYAPINLALYNDCDPEVYHGVYQFLSERERTPFFRNFNILCVANGIYYMGDFDSAIGYLKNNVRLDRCNPTQQLTYYNILANCYGAKGDMKELKLLEFDLSRIPTARMKRSHRYTLEACKGIVALHIAFLSGDYESARAGCDAQLESASYPFQRIGVHYRLGLIDRAEGNFESARSHLDYVAINGGSTYFVRFARMERLRMDEYIRSHPEVDPRKKTVFPPTISQSLSQTMAQAQSEDQK